MKAGDDDDDHHADDDYGNCNYDDDDEVSCLGEGEDYSGNDSCKGDNKAKAKTTVLDVDCRSNNDYAYNTLSPCRQSP